MRGRFYFHPAMITPHSASITAICNPQFSHSPAPLPASKAKPCPATPDNITNSLLSCRGHINLENIKNNKTRRVGRLLCPPGSAFVIDEPAKNRYYRLIKRMWRNWQTRRLQEPVGSTPWRFDSSHPHYLATNSRGLSAPTQDLTKGPCQADKYLGQTCILRTSFSRR